MLRTLGYLRKLCASILRSGGGLPRVKPATVRIAAVLTIGTALYLPLTAMRSAHDADVPAVEALSSRAGHVMTLLRAAERVYMEEVAPIERPPRRPCNPQRQGKVRIASRQHCLQDHASVAWFNEGGEP